MEGAECRWGSRERERRVCWENGSTDKNKKANTQQMSTKCLNHTKHGKAHAQALKTREE